VSSESQETRENFEKNETVDIVSHKFRNQTVASCVGENSGTDGKWERRKLIKLILDRIPD
jgi:hypothetical protein